MPTCASPANSAVFTTAFAQRGLIAEHGVSWLLPSLVGLPAALDLLCSARKFRAPEALSLGLVSRVIPDDKLLAETRAYARLMADTVSPRSVAVMKRQLWEAQFQTLAEATVQANHEMELSFQTADFKEGVAHYLEKRAARFTGRAGVCAASRRRCGSCRCGPPSLARTGTRRSRGLPAAA